MRRDKAPQKMQKIKSFIIVAGALGFVLIAASSCERQKEIETALPSPGPLEPGAYSR